MRIDRWENGREKLDKKRVVILLLESKQTEKVKKGAGRNLRNKNRLAN